MAHVYVQTHRDDVADIFQRCPLPRLPAPTLSDTQTEETETSIVH